MQADGLHRVCGEQGVQAFEQIARHRLVGRQQAARNKTTIEQGGQGFVAEVANCQSLAMGEWFE